jgi:hypothetical protein
MESTWMSCLCKEMVLGGRRFLSRVSSCLFSKDCKDVWIATVGICVADHTFI